MKNKETGQNKIGQNNSGRNKTDLGMDFLLGPAETFSFQGRLFNSAALVAAVVSLMGVVVSYGADVQINALAVSLAASLMFFSLYGMGRWRGFYGWLVWAFLGGTYFLLYGYWRVVDNDIGHFLPLMLALACVLPVLLSGWPLVLGFVLNCMAMTAVYLSVVIFPWDVINEHPSIFYLLVKFFSIMALGVGFSLPAVFISRNCRDQQETIIDLTFRDSLTGLYNQGYFNRIFQREINRARRDGKYLSLLMIDMDHFNHYNHRYGHEQGDAALTRIGNCLKQLSTRGSDYGFRMAGEEFAIVFSGLEPEAARAFAEKIRSEIERLQIEHIGAAAMVLTASLGLAVAVPGEDMNMDWYCYQAGQGLQAARQAGRNQVGVG